MYLSGLACFCKMRICGIAINYLDDRIGYNEIK